MTNTRLEPQTGSLKIVGLGPGDEGCITPETQEAIDQATDIVGYIPYVKRIVPRSGLQLHASDNRVELDRARAALTMAAEGKHVVVVSSGDPGVFAMASAVFEALETGPDIWRNLSIEVCPGITAMLAAAARVGAPLGHDFCTINLSDNLKPMALIEKRVRLAAEADFAMAFYNPRSKSRPNGFLSILNILKTTCDAARPIIFAKSVTTEKEDIRVVTLDAATPDMADMRTIVIVGSSQTRIVPRANAEDTPYVYTPRFAPGYGGL